MLPETNELAFPAPSFREGGKINVGCRWEEKRRTTRKEGSRKGIWEREKFFSQFGGTLRGKGRGSQKGERACEREGGGLKFGRKRRNKIKPLLVDVRRRGGRTKGALARAFSARATSRDLIGRSAGGHLSNGRNRPVNAG